MRFLHRHGVRTGWDSPGHRAIGAGGSSTTHHLQRQQQRRAAGLIARAEDKKRNRLQGEWPIHPSNVSAGFGLSRRQRGQHVGPRPSSIYEQRTPLPRHPSSHPPSHPPSQPAHNPASPLPLPPPEKLDEELKQRVERENELRDPSNFLE
jgi:hypothetical protein